MNSIKGNRAVLTLVLVGLVLGIVGLVTVGTVVTFQSAEDRAAQREAHAVVESARTSWMVATECGKGDAACDAALKTANANEWGVRFYEDGTAFRN